MIVSEKKYHKAFHLFLSIIPVSFIFMKWANILVILFIVFNLLFYKKLEFNKIKLILCTIISIPFLLDILFFWNNNNFYLALKATEKHLLFLIFPIIILGYKNCINLSKLLKSYVLLMLTLMCFLLVRYIIIYPEFVNKYLQGIHLWEMGYHFSKSFGNHAPALNMHLAFVSMICFYLILNLKHEKKLIKLVYVFQFLLSLFFLFYVNTRVAIVSSVLGISIISVFSILKNKNKKLIVKRTILLSICIFISMIIFVKIFPYSIKKFTDRSFANMHMVGRLDEFNNPEVEVFNALVTRVSIWKSALELSEQNILIGFGATQAKERLFDYYKDTNQIFLYKYKFAVHNQYIDYLLKYGMLGVVSVFLYMFFLGYLSIKSKEAIMFVFFVHFFLSNITDDFLLIYSGISFSAFWSSIFANVYYCKNHRKPFVEI